MKWQLRFIQFVSSKMCLGFGLMVLGLSWTGLGIAQHPNMVLYLADDHGILDCSVYGATDIPTPNMERLAEAGLTFTQAFVASPSCAPSRGAMLTGLMPARNGAEANHTCPRSDVLNLTTCLKTLGYEIVAFGKVAHGKKQIEQCSFDVVKSNSSCRVLKKEVTAYLQQRKSDKPLCLFVGTGNPHVPWPQETRFKPNEVILPPTHVDTPETRENRAMYYEEIAELDELLGDLRQLSQEYLGPNTLFVYTSDHGAQWPFGKWNLYDAGIRTPFIAAWPGVIKPASKTDAMISWIDLLPTLIDIAGGERPKDIDGRSFAAVLKGKKAKHCRRIFTTHSGDGDKNIYPIRAVRTMEWKYILNLHPEFAHTNHSDLMLRPGAGAYWHSWVQKAEHDPHAKARVDRYYQRPAEELYRIKDDPHEQKNLADDAQYTNIKAKLRKELEQWMTQQGDQKKVFNTPRRLDHPETWKPGLLKK